MIETIGWIGGVCLASCAVPQAWACWRTGHADGIDPWFLGLWLAGEICMSIYVLEDVGLYWPLILNYLANLAFIAVIVRYKAWPGRA